MAIRLVHEKHFYSLISIKGFDFKQQPSIQITQNPFSAIDNNGKIPFFCLLFLEILQGKISSIQLMSLDKLKTKPEEEKRKEKQIDRHR